MQRSSDRRHLPRVLQTAFLVGGGLALALVVFGRVLVPTTNLLGIGADLTILIIYGLLGGFCPPRFDRLNPQILRFAIGFGLFAGVIFMRFLACHNKLTYFRLRAITTILRAAAWTISTPL
jgi:hypothetical protein